MNDLSAESYRVLVVDDSPSILEIVRVTLTLHGFQVMAAESGERALEIMENEGLPHLGIFDINMPMGMDGLELCEKVLQFSDLPIIMLTAIDENSTIVEAIDRFAEDYMTKPVRTGEMLARVRRVLHSIGKFAYPLAQFVEVDENLSVNFATLTAVVQGKEVNLTPTETKLLYILMRQQGKIVSTDFMLRRLWPSDADFADEDRLRVYVHRLRSKIERKKHGVRYVFSKRRKGYVFLPEDD
ncbi:response regulator transcription factor [Candidatus Leptofilum sp.]|uniref:response regulator transcription factor n=1 Tax=Candidatus Leptofilum sp. TaxID=3241576 RepID=UPI003B5AD1AE